MPPRKGVFTVASNLPSSISQAQIKIGQTEMVGPFCGLARVSFVFFFRVCFFCYFLFILVLSSPAKRKEMDTEMEKERKIGESKGSSRCPRGSGIAELVKSGH